MYAIDVVLSWYDTELDVFGFMTSDAHDLAAFGVAFGIAILDDSHVTGVSVVVDDPENAGLQTLYVFVDEGSIDDLWLYTRFIRDLANKVLCDTVLNAE